jgi:hypothetical protein
MTHGAELAKLPNWPKSELAEVPKNVSRSMGGQVRRLGEAAMS